jgi:hypothetical protein
MIDFKPLHKDDLQLLYQWFQEPTSNQQYAQGQTWSLKDKVSGLNVYTLNRAPINTKITTRNPSCMFRA